MEGKRFGYRHSAAKGMPFRITNNDDHIMWKCQNQFTLLSDLSSTAYSSLYVLDTFAVALVGRYDGETSPARRRRRGGGGAAVGRARHRPAGPCTTPPPDRRGGAGGALRLPVLGRRPRRPRVLGRRRHRGVVPALRRREEDRRCCEEAASEEQGEDATALRVQNELPGLPLCRQIVSFVPTFSGGGVRLAFTFMYVINRVLISVSLCLFFGFPVSIAGVLEGFSASYLFFFSYLKKNKFFLHHFLCFHHFWDDTRLSLFIYFF